MNEITTELVDELEVDLMAARRTGEVVAYVVRYGACYTEALAVAQALVDRSRRRVGHRAPSAGCTGPQGFV